MWTFAPVGLLPMAFNETEAAFARVLCANKGGRLYVPRRGEEDVFASMTRADLVVPVPGTGTSLRGYVARLPRYWPRARSN